MLGALVKLELLIGMFEWMTWKQVNDCVGFLSFSMILLGVSCMIVGNITIVDPAEVDV